MNKDELTIHLLDLQEKNKWVNFEYDELSDGRIRFKVIRRTKKESEIIFDNYDRFTDFIAILAVS